MKRLGRILAAGIFWEPLVWCYLIAGILGTLLRMMGRDHPPAVRAGMVLQLLFGLWLAAWLISCGVVFFRWVRNPTGPGALPPGPAEFAKDSREPPPDLPP